MLHRVEVEIDATKEKVVLVPKDHHNGASSVRDLSSMRSLLFKSRPGCSLSDQVVVTINAHCYANLTSLPMDDVDLPGCVKSTTDPADTVLGRHSHLYPYTTTHSTHQAVTTSLRGFRKKCTRYM